MLISSLALILLSLTLAWTVLSKGGVHSSDRVIALLALGSIASLYVLLTSRRYRAPSMRSWVYFSIAAVPCYVVFQLIPFPLRVLQILSPARGALAAAMMPVARISKAPLSISPPVAVLWLFTLVAYIVVFLLMREIAWRFRSRPWIPLVPLFCIALLEASISAAQIWFGSSNGMISGTYTNRNHFSGFLELILPMSFVCAIAALKKSRDPFTSSLWSAIAACAAWILSIVLLLAIFYSLSRAGFMVALISLLMVGWLCLPLRRSSSKMRTVWAGALITLVLLFFVFFPPAELVERFADMSALGKASAEARPLIWKETLSLISEFRWFGCGLGGFESAFLKHQGVAAGSSIQFAHNDYLQYLAELGVLGFSVLMAAVAGVLMPILRGLKTSIDQDRHLVIVGCVGSMAAIAIHSVVDFNLYVPANAMTLAWIVGVGSANVFVKNRSTPPDT